jgi:hypothetical protein
VARERERWAATNPQTASEAADAVRDAHLVTATRPTDPAPPEGT